MVRLKLPHDDVINDPGAPEGSRHPPPDKKRRILITLLAVLLLLLFVAFPLLILYFENAHVQPELEPDNGPVLTSQLRRSYSYIDGLYWSLTTPIALGSKDAWPQSRKGWLMVRVSDAAKLLTVGVSARLLHDIVVNHKVRDIPRWRYIRYRRSRDDEPGKPRPSPQVYFFERSSALRNNKYAQKLAAIVVFVLLERNQGHKDRNNPDEDPPSNKIS